MFDNCRRRFQRSRISPLRLLCNGGSAGSWRMKLSFMAFTIDDRAQRHVHGTSESSAGSPRILEQIENPVADISAYLLFCEDSCSVEVATAKAHPYEAVQDLSPTDENT
jgi:hypothetical protein